MKKYLFGLAFLALAFGLWKNHQAKKTQEVESYYVESFAMDYVTQKKKNLKYHGELFEYTRHEMQMLGYSPKKIKEIMVKGFDRGNEILKQQNSGEKVG